MFNSNSNVSMESTEYTTTAIDTRKHLQPWGTLKAPEQC